MEIYKIYELDSKDNKADYQLFLSLIYEPDKELVNSSYQGSIKTGNQYDIRYRIKAGNSIKWIEARGVTYYRENGEPDRSIGTAKDISEIIAAQIKIEHLAYHDMLTGLANRKLFSDRLSESLLLADQNGINLVVMFIDLDNFKLVNDQYGHDVGDQILISVANRLKSFEQSACLFARIGGDEFAGFYLGVEDADIDNQVVAIKQAIDGTYHTSVHSFKITASVGATIYPQDNAEPDILLRHSDQAMYEVKEQGKSGIRYFDTERFQSNWSRRQLLKDIENALVNDQFELFYQPKIRLCDAQPAGAEALLRWFRPEGAVAPADIVVAIQNTSLEWELDKWVIENVLKHVLIFTENGLSGPFSLNVNPTSLQNPDFPQLLKSLLSKFEVLGDLIEIEILEVESIKDLDTARNVISQCKKLGVKFLIDDFGTGYSSLTYFLALPISKLKIDQFFIKSILSNPQSLLLVKSILAIAKENKKLVVAEGIETVEIAQLLAELKCEFGQGYGIAMPMPVEEYINWVHSR